MTAGKNRHFIHATMEVFRPLSCLCCFQSCGMMDCTRGKTRRKIHSVLSRRRSRLWCPISFSLSSLLVFFPSSFTFADVLLPPCRRVFYLDGSVTALYRLHAAGSRYSGRLDRHQKGKQEQIVGSMLPFRPR